MGDGEWAPGAPVDAQSGLVWHPQRAPLKHPPTPLQSIWLFSERCGGGCFVPFLFCLFSGGPEPPPAVALRADFWLCSQESLQAMLRGTLWDAGYRIQAAACKASVLLACSLLLNLGIIWILEVDPVRVGRTHGRKDGVGQPVCRAPGRSLALTGAPPRVPFAPAQ